jgi:homoserine O-succinyltransferase/O-acetyltransferase
MTVGMALDPGAVPDGTGGPVRWRCALVNNMPDTAFSATERQFVGLLEAGSGCETVVVTRHTMAGVPRGERTRARIAAEYRPLEDIVLDPPDLLVVTGSNPIESRIQDEPYWSGLCDLLRWGSENVPAMVLSCLAAHVALDVFDGVERTTLPEKCTGVFAQEADPTHPLAAGFDGPVVLPHSRLNTVPTDAVTAAGYAVALQSREVGWSVITKTVGRSEVVLVQAHPEYDPSSLVREYHRDVRRYADHERDELPCLPRDCVAGPDRDGLRRLHERVVAGERDPALVAAFPFDEVGARAPWPWRGAALRLYANLLGTIPNRLLDPISKRSA